MNKFVFRTAVALFFFGASDLHASDFCPQELSSSLSGPIDDADLDVSLKALSRFALDEVQRPDQPGSVRAGLSEDLENKLHELAERSGLSLAELRRRLLEAKRASFFADRSPSSRTAGTAQLRRELDQLPDFYTYRIRQYLQKSVGPGYSVQFDPFGERIASAEGDVVRILDARTGQVVRLLTGHTQLIYSVAFSPDGTQLATASGDGSVRIWDPASGEWIKTLKRAGKNIKSAVFSPDGQKILMTTGDREVWIANLRGSTGRHRIFTKAMSALTRPQFVMDGGPTALSKDGAVAVVRGVEIWVWRRFSEFVELGAPIKLSYRHSLASLTFSPDGRFLLGGTRDGRLARWEITRQKTPPHLWSTVQGWERFPKVNCVAFSPDGLQFVSCGQRMLFWNSRTLRLIREENSAYVEGVAFSADGEQLISTGAGLALWQRVRVDLDREAAEGMK